MHKVKDILHMCHSHWGGRDGRALRTERSAEEGSIKEDYTAEELFDLFSIPLPEPTTVHPKSVPTAGKTNTMTKKEQQQRAPVIIVSRAAPREEGEEEEEINNDKKMPAFITNLCAHVTKDKQVSIIVLVAVVTVAIIEFLALIFCLAGWRTGCRKCWAKCGQLTGSSPLV